MNHNLSFQIYLLLNQFIVLIYTTTQYSFLKLSDLQTVFFDIYTVDNAIFKMEHGFKINSLGDVISRGNGIVFLDSIIRAHSFRFSENSTLHLNPNAFIERMMFFYFRDNATFEMGNNSSIIRADFFRFNGNSTLHLNSNATIENIDFFDFRDNTTFEMDNYSSLKFADFFDFNGNSTLLLHEHSLVNSIYDISFGGNSTFMMFSKSSINSTMDIYINGNSTFTMNSSEITSIKNRFYLSNNANFLMYNDAVIKNVTQIEINNGKHIFETNDNSFVNASNFKITNGTFVLNGNDDRNSVNSTNLSCINNGTIFVTNTSHVNILNTTIFNFCNIKVIKRTIRDLPIFFTYQINTTIFSFQNSYEVDLACSIMPIRTTLPQGTKLLIDGRLLRLGSSNKVFCHLMNENGFYSEPYCPCSSVNCYITPFKNITFFNLYIDTLPINSQHKTNELEEVLDIESVSIENKKVSFYKTDNFVLCVNSQSLKLITNISSLTKTVLLVSTQYFVFKKVVSQAIYTTNNHTEYLINPECEDGLHFNTITQECEKCTDLNCLDCFYNTNECLRCQHNYNIDRNGRCAIIPNCSLKRSNRCFKCSKGYLLVAGSCQKSTNCLIQTFDEKCQICDLNTFNINNTQCVHADDNTKYTNQNNIITCESGYVTNSTNCQKCSEMYNSSLVCENGHPTKCEITTEMNSNKSCENKNCSIPNDQNGRCSSPIAKCNFITNSVCLECNDNLIPNKMECRTNDDLLCTNQSSVSCLRCEDFYFYSSSTNKCEKCDLNCMTCVINSTHCITCPLGYYLSNNTCNTNAKLIGICTQLLSSGGCVKCIEGYYRNGLDCNKCDISCASCNTNLRCLTCNITNYKTSSGDCKSQSSLIGCDVNVTQYGCTRCKDGYFQVNTNECDKCDMTCLTCSSYGICESCISSEVLLSNGKCVNLSQILECNEISNSKCIKCSFWNEPSLDGTYCEKHTVWWVILVIVLFIIIVLTLFIILLVFTVKHILKKIHTKELEKTTTIFKMEKSNINFVPLANHICVSSKTLNFNSEIDEIPVESETKMVFCVGNASRNVLKIQFTMTTQIDKFTIRVSPEVVMLKKKFACEFSIYLTPKCTCQINNKICIVSKNLKTNVENTNEILMIGVTSQSTRIDYEELIEESKLGEGSFGVVYKGKYRGNTVAIKKMKQSGENTTLNNDKNDEEFEKEVAMLDKFRCEYIVHFYGAVLIPSKMCLVTEFAQHGCLSNVMKKFKKCDIQQKMKIKMMIDIMYGISYLHTNGILHRDIKPDNVLVFSFDHNNKVNAKLTDFGSSRNINMLMTNMTFTKGVGSPIYMAPEILKREKYKKSADVFSLAITMYECFTWTNAYPKEYFKFPWTIAEFVIKGLRLPKPDEMSQGVYNIIVGCWDNEPKKRSLTENILDKLETIYKSI
ncbi:protein serine/threonine kinase, putative [Entamoeba invadens IP1]|uniref:Protein serine/threonine kinase, putative n=1 Tax=Entamoeba invadens IP1 TaxID=370355 RepID=A0A0A1UCF1_ENTIV|nr:protein serine/threonine kinase, putative [Entamoeba invadens IP1]ELP89959.1 protein serine/threonine kinase, putative [Entamoeba invadens IP1]|eukprot:XP_004256730.1 protein serine/threonine kinase, putative [Entamoeba invadens IP1]